MHDHQFNQNQNQNDGSQSSTLYSIGHSGHRIDVFIDLLKRHGVNALADVRSLPYSRRHPHFSQSELKKSLADAKIAYVFLGKELGARPQSRACYRDGKVCFDLVAKEPLFLQGLERLRLGMNRFQIALMCAEKDPLQCHRAVLVSRRLFESGTSIQHIQANGALEAHQAMEDRMLQKHEVFPNDIFHTRQRVLDDVYRIHGDQIAYEVTDANVLTGKTR